MKYIKFFILYLLGPASAGAIVFTVLWAIKSGAHVEPAVTLACILSFSVGYADSRFTLGLIDRFK